LYRMPSAWPYLRSQSSSRMVSNCSDALEHKCTSVLSILRHEKPAWRGAVFADVRVVGISVGPHSDTSPDQPQHFGNVRQTRFVQAVRRLAQARDGKYRGASHSKEPADGSACAPVLIACSETRVKPGSGCAG